MAQSLIALGSSWSVAGNWAVCDAAAESDSEAANTALTTSYVVSSTFNSGAVTVDGIAVKVASRAASPTGTISIALDQAGVTVAGTEVTINVSDIDTANGWLLVKFTGVVLVSVVVGVKAKTSSAAQVNLYSTATTNWSRELRTTTTSAAGVAAGDKVICTNEKTGANAQNTITQTVDNDQSAVTFGATTYPQSLHVSNGGKVAFSTVASANPKIKWAGIVQVYGGTFNVGNSAGDPIPSTSTADLQMASAVNVDSGLVFANGSTVNIYGYAKKSTQIKLSQNFGGYCISDHTGVWASLIQGAGNNVVAGYPAGSWNTGGGFGNGDAITFTSVTVLNTTFAKTLAASNAIRNWASVSISAMSNAAACVCTYNGTTALTTGMYVYIAGVTGAWSANGSWTQCNGWQRVTSVSGTTFSIPINTTNLGAFGGSPVFSGSAVNITVALAVDTSFGWLPKGGSAVITVCNLDGTAADLSDVAANDVIALACSGRLTGECETGTVSSADNTAKTITFTANLLYPHCSMVEVGNAAVACEVINITRNVKFHGASSSLQGYVLAGTTAVVNGQYSEFTQLGSGTNTKQGITAQTTTGTFILKYCSIHDSTVASGIALIINGTSGQTASTVIASNNCFYNLVTPVSIGATSGTWVMDSNIGILATGSIFSLSDVGGTFTNNVAVGGTTGISASEAGTFVSFSGNTAHGNSSNGIAFGPLNVSSAASITSWRNVGSGIVLGGNTARVQSSSFDTCVAFGNNPNILLNSNAIDCLFTNAVLNGDAAFSTPVGLISQSGVSTAVVETGTFGVSTGLTTAHTTNDLQFTSYTTIITRNCKLASQTPVASWASATLYKNAFVLHQKYQQTAGFHQCLLQYGINRIDTVIFNTASPSLRMTPNSASNKLESAPTGGYGAIAAVASGGTITVSVVVRKSVSTDAQGANYNGNQQRLILRKNVAAGIAADTVLATASAAVGVWETLTGPTTPVVTDDAVLEFTVDCDGTVGWINIDDWVFTPVANTKGNRYFFDGVPSVSGDNIRRVLARDFTGF